MTFLMLLPVVAGALAVGAVWIPKDALAGHARIDVGGAVLSTVGLGGLGAGLTSLTNASGLNLWVLVTLIVGLGGLAGLIVTQRRLGDNAMLPHPSSPRGRWSVRTCSPRSSTGRSRSC